MCSVIIRIRKFTVFASDNGLRKVCAILIANIEDIFLPLLNAHDWDFLATPHDSTDKMTDIFVCC